MINDLDNITDSMTYRLDKIKECLANIDKINRDFDINFNLILKNRS